MRRWAMALSVVALAAGSLSVAVPMPAHAAAGCQVTYAVTSSWTTGFVADVRLTNLGDPVTSWQLTWSFTAGQTVTDGWYGVFSQSGADVTVANATWNGTLAAGASAAVGFTGTWSGTNPPPSSFSLNGTLCVSAPTVFCPVSVVRHGSSYEATVVVTNRGSAPLTNWSVQFIAPPPSYINPAFTENATLTLVGTNGTLTPTAPYATIPAGNIALIRFAGHAFLFSHLPTAFNVGGTPCQASYYNQ
jgi:hypothetical protein